MKTKQEQSFQTKQKLKDALIELTGTKNISRISIRELTEAAVVHRSTFYLYYSGTEDLISEIENELLSNMEEYSINAKNDKLGADVIPESYIQMMEYHLQIRKYLLALYGPNGDPAFIYKVNGLLRKYSLLSLKNSGYAFEAYDDYTLTFYINGIQSIVLQWLIKQDISIPEMLNLMQRSLINLPFLA